MSHRSAFFTPAVLAFPLAALTVVTSIAGITVEGWYGRETAVWAAQAIGQDKVNLFVVVPTLAVTAALTLTGSRLFSLLLGGALLYSAYTFVIFAFAVHFNLLFLVYCAALGLAFYALVGLLSALRDADVRGWFSSPCPVRLTGGFLIVFAAMMTWVWLSEVVPAIVAGATPQSVTDAGLLTNPVHVIDLAFVLPALLVTGVALFRQRSFGFLFAPIALSFALIMALAIAGMAIELVRSGLTNDLTVVRIFGVVTFLSVAVLWRFLRCLQPAGKAPATGA